MSFVGIQLIHGSRHCCFARQVTVVRHSPSYICTFTSTRTNSAFRLRNTAHRRFRSTVNAPKTTSTSSTFPSSSPEGEPKERSLILRIFGFIFIAISSSAVGFYMATIPIHQTIHELAHPPTDEETLNLFNPIEEDSAYVIHHHINNHSLTKTLLADPKFKAARPHLKIPPALRGHNFTGGILLGEDKIPVPPLQFSTEDGSEFVSLQYLGVALCGHPGIVHGGLLATLLDEGLARCCFPALPNKVGVTASLKIDYRKPCMAGQYTVLKAETTKVDGRKAWVKGRMETLPDDGSPGEVLVEAEALFIEPRQAKAMARVYSST
ncbi:hypothetical protein EJ08DRAFT_680586 [Tothia fuscella]|uniref:Thioesterase domain-containing protein n=1 Tax=Tothia fuscella TaxID=1048955 RepID=A0A9P4NNC7_9PEZI|nr:hypothetical protein EJ08DRAFT_680586 [Tothia fuscella]